MTRARRQRGRGPSRWWRSVEAIAMGTALASGLFSGFSALEWRHGQTHADTLATTAGLAILALGTWRLGRAAKRRAEAIERREQIRTSRPNAPTVTDRNPTPTRSPSGEKRGRQPHADADTGNTRGDIE